MDKFQQTQQIQSLNYWQVSIHRSGTIATVAVGLASAMLFAIDAQAADAINSKVEASKASTHFTPGDWRTISLSASHLLMNVDDALDALAEKKNDVAAANIEKGITLTKILYGVLPATTVKTEITGAGITYQDSYEVKQRFVPIYSEFDLSDAISPVHVQKTPATKSNGANVKQKSTSEVSSEIFDYTDVKLNLRLARRDLLSAQDLLKSGDVAAVKLLLQDIQANGVIFEFSVEHVPLALTMADLRLAESEMRDNRLEQAKAALNAASDSLKTYETSVGNNVSKDVKKLREDIDDATKNLAQYNPDTFAVKITNWWGKCVEWLEKLV